MRATHATFQMLNWPSPESMRPADAPLNASGQVITTVMSDGGGDDQDGLAGTGAHGAVW